VDLGVAGMVKKQATLNSVFIHREQLLFVCSPQNPLAARESVALSELEGIPFIWREKGTQTLELVKQWFQENAGGDFPHQTLSLANMEAAKRIVEEGFGVTIIPATAARREIDAGLLKRLDVEGFALTVDYGLFYPKGRLFSSAAEAFLTTLCSLGIFSDGKNLRGHPWRTRDPLSLDTRRSNSYTPPLPKASPRQTGKRYLSNLL
jgi:DNA-binding transcriptional LysR family regulator